MGGGPSDHFLASQVILEPYAVGNQQLLCQSRLWIMHQPNSVRFEAQELLATGYDAILPGLAISAYFRSSLNLLGGFGKGLGNILRSRAEK